MNKFFILIICMFTANVYAGMPNEIGSITFFQIHKAPDSKSSSNERFIVRLSGSVSEPSCGNSSTWTGYLDSDAGRAQYSAILAASISGKSIKLQGTDPNSCLSSNLLIRNVYIVW
jgi:hypothetical protein